MAASKNIRNIRPEEPDRFEWDDADPAKSLHKIRNAVEVEGQKAIDWYWKAKRWKRIPSQSIQFCALLLTAAAGLVPIILQVIKNARAVTTVTDSGPLAALFIGIAAALLGLDKAFGYSSGWTRYVLTATSMTKLLHEFRMDCVMGGCSRTACGRSGTAGHCSGTAGHCNRTAGHCNRTAGHCNRAAGHRSRAAGHRSRTADG